LSSQLGSSFIGLENFIKDALYKPNEYIAYHVGRELAKLHPEKAIIEGETGYFDLEGFSFAYLKELFLSSMMQWMSAGTCRSMDQVALQQALQLRAQMTKKGE